MGAFRNFIIGTLGVAVVAGATALAIPQSRNFVLDKIAEQSQIYKTAMDNNSKLEQDNKDLKDTSTAQEEALAKLKIDLETKSTALTKCQGDLETVTGKKTELETTLASKEIEIQNLTQDKTDLTTQLTTANSEKETLQTQLDTANSEKSELQTTVTNLTNSVETLTAQKNTLETQLTTSESDKQALQTQLDSVNAQLETAQSNLATAQSSLATKTSDVENLTSQLAEKQSQIDTLTSQLAEKQSQIDQVNSDKQSLQSQLDSANTQISTLQSQISTLETEKADLQKQVDDLKASADVVMTKSPYYRVTLRGTPLDNINYLVLPFKDFVEPLSSAPSEEMGFDIGDFYTFSYTKDSGDTVSTQCYSYTESFSSTSCNISFLDVLSKREITNFNELSELYPLIKNCCFKLDDKSLNYTINDSGDLTSLSAKIIFEPIFPDGAYSRNNTSAEFYSNSAHALFGFVTYGNAVFLPNGQWSYYYKNGNDCSFFYNGEVRTVSIAGDIEFDGDTYMASSTRQGLSSNRIVIKCADDHINEPSHMQITFTSDSKILKIGATDSTDATSVELEFVSLENGKLTLRRTDTQEEIVIRDVIFSYDSTTEKYVFKSGQSALALYTDTYKD